MSHFTLGKTTRSKILACLLGLSTVFMPAGYALAEDTELPTVQVTGTRFGWQVVCYGMACADFLDSFNSDFQFNPDLIPLSGGGESEAETPTKEDHKDNPDAAPCTASPNARLRHAARVFHKWRARRFGAMISRGRGQIINVTFTDGGTERYMWIPGSMPAHTSPPELYLTAVPGTKSCQ